MTEEAKEKILLLLTEVSIASARKLKMANNPKYIKRCFQKKVKEIVDLIENKAVENYKLRKELCRVPKIKTI